MIYKRTGLFITLFLAIILAGCGFFAERYANKEYRFSIIFPAGWKVDENVNGTVVLATAPQRGSAQRFAANINVVVNNMSEQMSLETFFELSKETTLQVIPGEKYNISEGDIYAASQRGKWLSFAAKIKELDLHFISATWIKDKRIYVVTGSCEAQIYPHYETIFKKVFSSLRLK